MTQPASWSRYASPRDTTQRLLVSCHGAGEQGGPVQPFAGRSLPTHALVYISAGRGTYQEFHPRAVRIAVQAPAVLWLRPGVQHGYGPDADGWTEHWVLFTGPPFAVFEELGLGSRHDPVQALARPVEAVDELFGTLRESLSAVGPRAEIAASVATQRLLLAILDAGEGAPATTSPTVDLLVRGAARPLSVAARAREAGLTVRELAQVVKASTGLTVNELVIEVRIAQAQTLLAETRDDVGRIAARVGYDDPAYFSRLFRRRTGVSPTVFRDQQSRVGVGE